MLDSKVCECAHTWVCAYVCLSFHWSLISIVFLLKNPTSRWFEKFHRWKQYFVVTLSSDISVHIKLSLSKKLIINLEHLCRHLQIISNMFALLNLIYIFYFQL